MPTPITPRMIDEAQERGAPDEMLAWLRADPRTVDNLARQKPEWALWAWKHGVLGIDEPCGVELFRVLRAKMQGRR